MVESIEVLAEAVHSVVAVEDSVRVEHRNDHEVELSPELDCFWVIADQEINQPVHRITRPDFSRMHPRSDQNQRLMNFPKVFLAPIGKEMLHILFRRVLEHIAAGDGNKMDWSSLISQRLLSGERTSTSLLK